MSTRNMRVIGLCLLLNGCAINVTPEKIIYQDKQVVSLDVEKMQSSFDTDLSMAKLSKVSINTANGVVLNGISFIHPQAKVSIVLFGGSGMKISSSVKILERFALIPANVTWFDYRGVGASTKKESLSIDDFKKDALNVFDFANKLNKQDLPIIIHGISMGSIIVSELINERNIDGVVLDGAIGSVTDLITQTTPLWTKLFSTVTVSPELASLNNIDKIREYQKPLLLLVGENDETTPVKFSQALYDVSSSKVKILTIIPDIDHGRTMKKEEAILAYQEFIKQIP